MKHPQAEIIKVWVEETTELWVWLEESKEWKKSYILEVITCPNLTYAIGDKPTSPPVKMCELAGVKFPAPVLDASVMLHDKDYWVANPFFGSHKFFWNNTSNDARILEMGFVHLTQKNANLHGDALQAANLQAIMEAQ
jgi:hypothetical protein